MLPCSTDRHLLMLNRQRLLGHAASGQVILDVLLGDPDHAVETVMRQLPRGDKVVDFSRRKVKQLGRLSDGQERHGTPPDPGPGLLRSA